MHGDELAPLEAAYRDFVAVARMIPDEALDWQPAAEEWSLKRTLAHVAHAYDFYRMIVDEARASGFGSVRLHPDLPSWKRVLATNAEVEACATTRQVMDRLARAHEEAVAALRGIAPEELDRPFLLLPWRPDVEPETITLRRRVLYMATSHLREHEAQLAATLERWNAAR